MHPPTAGEIRFGDERESRARHNRSAVEWGDDDAGAGSVEQRRALGYGRDDVDDDALVGQNLCQSVGRSATVGGEQHAIAVGAQRDETLRQGLGVSDHRIERAGGQVRRRGVLGRGQHGNHAGLRAREQPVEGQRQAR